MQLSVKISCLVFACLSVSIVCTLGYLNEKKELSGAKEAYEELQKEHSLFYKSDKIHKEPLLNGREEDAFIQAPLEPRKKEWFQEKKEEFPDMVGWLMCEGTPINYPVMQARDNEYYLNHLPNGLENKLGSLFLDISSSKDFTSSISVIYGHMVKSGEMFGSLSGYRSQSYYETYPEFTLVTEDSEKKIQILAAYLVNGEAETYPAGFAQREDWEIYIKKAKDNSFIKSNVNANPDDKLVIFSTCAYDFEDARLAVLGRIV